MASLDLLNNNAFSMAMLTEAVNKVPYKPGFLGSLNLFADRRLTTTIAGVEEKNGVLSLIQTTPRGGPIEEGSTDKRNVLYKETVRIAKGQTIYSHEIQNVRAFGSETELESLMGVIADRLNGPTGLIAQVEYTWENMRLGAIQGIVTDADSSTLVDWASEFGVSLPTEIDFDLDNASPASGVVRKNCATVVRGVQRKLGGLWQQGSSYVMGLCGDAFWDDFIAHAEVRATYANTQMAAELRGNTAYESLSYGGITFVNYRGSDDASTIAVGTDKCKFVPVNVPGLFIRALSPSESMGYVNTPGMPLYSMIVRDKDRDMWARPEVYSYPLFICTVPAALYRAKRT